MPSTATSSSEKCKRCGIRAQIRQIHANKLLKSLKRLFHNEYAVLSIMNDVAGAGIDPVHFFASA